MLSVEEMGRDKDLSHFDRGQIFIARRLHQNMYVLTTADCEISTTLAILVMLWHLSGHNLHLSLRFLSLLSLL